MTQRIIGLLTASAVCVWLYWPGLVTFFSMDDFAWLGLGLSIHDGSDLVKALLSPMAQGTVRPLSERLYFLTLHGLFGLEPLPFRLVAFGFQLLNLWMAMRLVERMTGSRAGGLAAAILWIVNSALALAMSWSSAFNQILWPCFLLAGCHARWTWLTTGDRRARWAEWAVFLLGFGALELQVIYPAIAGAMTLLYRRERWKELVPLFAVAGVYAIVNRFMAPAQGDTVYRLYWDSGILTTAGTYLRMASGMWRPALSRAPEKWWLAAECLVALGAVAGLVWLVWRRERMAAFGAVWFLAALAPILPLKHHISDYYLTVPVLGLAMALGTAAVRRPLLAALPAVVYLAGSAYWARQTATYNYLRAEHGRVLFAGVEAAAKLYPGKMILLTAVTSDQYWGLINDGAFRLIRGAKVYLAPGGHENIEKHPELGDPKRSVAPAALARAAFEAGQAVVLAPAGDKLRNMTGLWREISRDRMGDEFSPVVDAGEPLLAGQLDGGWHTLETGFRWSAGRATLRLGEARAAKEIFVEAFRGPEEGKRGKVTLTVRLNGEEAGRWESEGENSSLQGAAPIPAGLDRNKPVKVELTIEPVLREEGSGGRQLGLAFGKIGFR